MSSSLLALDLAHRLEVAQNHLLQEYKLSHQQIQILAYLNARPGQEVIQTDLEKEMDLQSSTVTVLLQNLEKKGFVEKTACAYDKRKKLLRATEKSEALHETFLSSVYAIEYLMTGSLTGEEIAQLKRLLEKAYQNVRQHQI